MQEGAYARNCLTVQVPGGQDRWFGEVARCVAGGECENSVWDAESDGGRKYVRSMYRHMYGVRSSSMHNTIRCSVMQRMGVPGSTVRAGWWPSVRTAPEGTAVHRD